ncbi:Sperm-tail PG-rich repeat [Popillia japonica]|uniref:Sperm-tail PG-rich repeat n=1 Tax=Popillia japonica TaxID=7064 RepID=A0AAW1LEI7_POPJA
MYNLAQRQGLPKVGETPDNVAANTYILDSYKTFKENRVPFLTKTERHFQISYKFYTDAIYNPYRTGHIKGGSSIQNKSQRTLYVPNDTPSPTAYNPQKITKKQPHVSHLPPPGKGKLYVCRPPRFSNTAPSIPTRIDENGYYIDEYGNLQKNSPDEYDTTLGPAFYHVNTDTSNIIGSYKGCQWSKRRAKRTTTDISKTPAPGTYNIETSIGKIDSRDEYVREMARLFSYVPRTLEANELKLLQEDLPGPGRYDTNISTLKGHKHTGIHPPPLVIASKRFVASESDTPAPNAYNLQDYPKRRRCSLLDVPFGSEAPRDSIARGAYGPGPAAYSPSKEKLSRKRGYYGCAKSAFNSTAVRKIDFVTKDTLCMPGPANYIVEPLVKPQLNVSGCHFRSTTERFPDIVQSENVEPATYSISATFNKNRDRTSHNTGKVPFQSRQPKCTERISDNPGPADYLGHAPFKTKSTSFNRSLRFTEWDQDSPGPGQYFIEPCYSDSVYKTYTTHNLRLKENVLRQKLRLPPNKTWESWYKQLKTKKRLKCYASFEKRMYDYV